MQAPAVHEEELFERVHLCDARGRLRRGSEGWSRQPIHTCNLRGHWPRKKRWNYWAVTSDTHLFSVAITDLDYIGTCFAYLLDFRTGRMLEQAVLTPLALGYRMPETVAGSLNFQHPTMRIELLDSGDSVRLHLRSPRFGGVPLDADMAVSRPPGHETLNVVIPWSRDRFHFTSKQTCLPACGTVRLGDDSFEFPPGGSFACLDFGRGIWKYRCFWNWGAASGTQAGRTVGLNLGGGWTDGTGMTENGLCVDGRLTKLHEELSFDYDPSDMMRPWRITSRGSDGVDLTFEPFFERVARTNLLLLRSEVRQMIGRYSGAVVTEAGEKLHLAGMIGWVEQHRARW